jgi:ornithine cyclodeaminase
MSVVEASVMAVIGTGKQALAQVAAAVGQRPISIVRVFSPTRDNREAFGERLRARVRQLDVGRYNVLVCDSIEAAVDGADIVTTVTRSRQPFLEPGMLPPHTLVNALGAITPERAEIAEALVAGASIVVSDSPDVALDQSSELRHAGDVRALSAVVAEAGAIVASDGLRLFKAMGLGLADIAVAAEVLRQCMAEGRGTALPAKSRAAPQLFSSKTSQHNGAIR